MSKDKTEFKVGDWVQAWDGDQGTVVEAPGNGYVDVDFEKDGLTTMETDELDLISGNSEEAIRNRAKNASFQGNVRRITDQIADLLIEKNRAYGDSALNPIRVFSKVDRMEQLFIRLDDKLSRIQRGHEYPGDDTIRDIMGYCALILIAKESE